MKISVIVPIYNSEKYIPRCIESILVQTFEEYEIILINDGSKDASGLLIDNYKVSYPDKIKVIHQDNIGVAATRNKGIQIASGDYIAFIDNDDYIKRDYLEKFYHSSLQGTPDIVMGGYTRINEEGRILTKKRLKKGEFSRFSIVSPWAKIFKKDFLISNDIQFLNTNIGEDVYFNIICSLYTSKINYITYDGYYWFFNEASVSNTSHTGFRDGVDITFMLNEIKSIITEHNLYSSNLYQYFFYRYIVWYLLYSGKTASPDDFMKEYKKLKIWSKSNLNSKLYWKYAVLPPKGDDIKIWATVRIFRMLDTLHMIRFFSYFYCRKKEVGFV